MKPKFFPWTILCDLFLGQSRDGDIKHIRTSVLIVSWCNYYKCCTDYELLEGTYQFSFLPTVAALSTMSGFIFLANERSHNTKNRRAYCWLSSLFCICSFIYRLGSCIDRHRYWHLIGFIRYNKLCTSMCQGFPKESTCNAGDLGSIPSMGQASGERNSYSLQYSGLGDSMDCIESMERVGHDWVWQRIRHDWVSFTFSMCQRRCSPTAAQNWRLSGFSYLNRRVWIQLLYPASESLPASPSPSPSPHHHYYHHYCHDHQAYSMAKPRAKHFTCIISFNNLMSWCHYLSYFTDKQKEDSEKLLVHIGSKQYTSQDRLESAASTNVSQI